jgi:hypothetical protein
MIIFYGANFTLNVTNLNIKFIEESSFFFDAFYKNYTPPFSMDLDDETSKKLGLIDVENVANYSLQYEGKLFIDTKFEDAYLVIDTENETLEGSFYYGKETLSLLETPLKELPFKTITASNIAALADTYIIKSWPEVSCNFPMVFDDGFSKTTNYDSFLGITNNHNGSNFLNNVLSAEGTVLNRNVLTPFPYIMEILKVGFSSAGKEIVGGFVHRKENSHLLLDTKKHLERFSTSTENNFVFVSHTDQYLIGNTLISEFEKVISITAIGTYNVKVSVNLPKDTIVKTFKILQDSVVLFESTSNSIQQELAINKEVAAGTIVVTFVLELEGNYDTIEDFNNFSFEKSEGKLNIFKNEFSLAEVMPDITFGAFLEKLKNWLNLKIDLYTNFVAINYVEEFFDVLTFNDERAFEIQHPKREFNKIKRYKITTSNPYSEIFVGKMGLASSIDDIREEDIRTIETGISIYPIEEREGIFTAVRNTDANFGIFLYKGIDANGYPVVASAVEGFSFSLQELYPKYWKKWLYFRLNSETYTDKFTAHSLEEFSTLVGRFKYSKKHIIKKITKSRVSEEQYLYEIESETL